MLRLDNNTLGLSLTEENVSLVSLSIERLLSLLEDDLTQIKHYWRKMVPLPFSMTLPFSA